jgi:gliding motility-associated-like protein
LKLRCESSNYSSSTGCLINIPNVFSPNGDGINDVFDLGSLDNQEITILKFYIFDRWGNNVFSGHNLNMHASDVWWDGRFKGNTMNPGVFAYYIEAEFEQGDRKTSKGDITLVR